MVAVDLDHGVDVRFDVPTHVELVKDLRFVLSGVPLFIGRVFLCIISFSSPRSCSACTASGPATNVIAEEFLIPLHSARQEGGRELVSAKLSIQ